MEEGGWQGADAGLDAGRFSTVRANTIAMKYPAGWTAGAGAIKSRTPWGAAE